MDFYGLLNIAENHGVPGSNPGPATLKVLQIAEKYTAATELPKPLF
jgi:hypothetical protein